MGRRALQLTDGDFPNIRLDLRNLRTYRVSYDFRHGHYHAQDGPR